MSQAAMLAELLPTEVRPAAPAAPARMEAAPAFRQVLEEWKAENRNLAKDSLRKYDQLATMMESWQPDLRPDQVTRKVAKECQQHLLDLQKPDATIRGQVVGDALLVRQVRQARNRVAQPVGGGQPVGNGPAVEV